MGKMRSKVQRQRATKRTYCVSDKAPQTGVGRRKASRACQGTTGANARRGQAEVERVTTANRRDGRALRNTATRIRVVSEGA